MRKFLISILVGVLMFAGAGIAYRHATAQVSPTQVLVNWQAATYAPPDFTGKVLPTLDSKITAGVDLFDRGKHIDLSKYKVFWYLNDNFYQGGLGTTRITFNAPHFVGRTTIQLRVSFPDYGSGPSREVEIPVVAPEAVIQASSASIAANAVPFSLQAYPYFFNVQSPAELQFLWTLRGGLVSNQNLFVATRQAAEQGSNARLEVQVVNPARPVERITNYLTIFPSY